MRLIDADKLLDIICDDQCGEHRCDSRCELAGYVENAPTVEAVPLVPLARWLMWYAMPPTYKPMDIVGKSADEVRDRIEAEWIEFLRGMDWEDEDDGKK